MVGAEPRPFSVTPSVVGLLKASRPSTVRRAVRAVIVDALKRMSWRWPWSHVTPERCEVVEPLGAHGNPSAAVMRVVWIIGVGAAVFGRGPGPILGRVRGGVSSSLRSGEFFLQASATSRRSSGYVSGSPVNDVPARASADAHRSPRFNSRNYFKNGQATVCGADVDVRFSAGHIAPVMRCVQVASSALSTPMGPRPFYSTWRAKC